MSMRLALALSCAASALLCNACTTGPTNGDTVAGAVFQKKLTFAGYYNEPSAAIRLEVMTSPTLDPNAPGSWVQFASATTGTNPLFVNSTDPLYAWSVEAAPVSKASEVGRWPQGGLVRVRAVHPKPDGDFALVTFDDVTFSDCFNQLLAEDADWTTIGLECQGVGGKTAALVSISNIPVPPGDANNFSVNGFLGRKGEITPGETELYYLETQAPFTLTAFKNKYGFPGAEITATYYNNGDLGFGREMHCKKFQNALFLTGIACYVTNYAGAHDANGKGVIAFDVDPNIVLADTVAKQHAFATVAMTFEPWLTENAVKFVVYNGEGVRQNVAQLDSTENNTSIPNNCLACHGINARYSAATRKVSEEARFLPFDPYSFKFSSAPGFTFNDQIDEIRRLNQLITLTQPSPAITEFINGLYAPKSVNDPTAVSNDDYVPDDWSQANGSLAGTALYRGVVKVACRTCHMSATSRPDLDFADYSDFTSNLSTIKADVCGNPHVMPHAERVLKNFWQSGARAYLVTGFGSTSYPDPLAACKP